MGKAITEELKKQISEFYRGSDMTNFEIAKALDVSPRSVRRYKSYDVMARPSSTQISQSSQAIESIEEPIESIQDQPSNTIEEPDNIDYEAETIPDNDDFSEKKSLEYVEVTKCPGCDTPKSEWTTIGQAIESGYNINEGHQRFYSYVCTNPDCLRLIPEKRLHVPGTCPGCGSTSIDWMPIEDTFASDEEKREYDFVCVDCLDLIKVID